MLLTRTFFAVPESASSPSSFVSTLPFQSIKITSTSSKALKSSFWPEIIRPSENFGSINVNREACVLIDSGVSNNVAVNETLPADSPAVKNPLMLLFGSSEKNAAATASTATPSATTTFQSGVSIENIAPINFKKLFKQQSVRICMYLSQLGGGGDILNIIWLVFFVIFMLYGQRLMITQTVWKLEKDVQDLEALSAKTRIDLTRKIDKNPSDKLKQKVANFMDFFAVSPVDADPFGIIKKIDMLVRQSDRKFRMFVDSIVPSASAVEKSNIKDALAGAMTTHQIAKIVRHMIEMIKKYKILQLALILQMQFPLIVKMAKAASAATYAFADGVPIGDGAGPAVIASFTSPKTRVKVSDEDEFSVAQVKINGRSVLVAKAHGPGATTGYPGKFLLKLFKRQKFNHIITVDAALKLEGERTGSLAEGVGVAMGGPGVDRYEIEGLALQYGIPLDAIAIKMDDEEALQPMPEAVWKAVPNAIEKVKEVLKTVPRSKRVLIIGVGNTCGVADTSAGLKEAESRLKKMRSKIVPPKKEKKGWF